MDEKRPSPHFPGQKFQKFLLKTKLCLFFAMVLTFSAIANVNAQQERVTLRLRNVSVKTLFQEIQKQTDLNFVFNTEQAGALKPISIDVRSETVDNVLRQVLSDSDLTYEFDGNLIIVRPASQLQAQVSQQVEEIKLTGKVVDENNELLPGVAVMIKGTTLGTATDADGKFELTLPSGKDIVLVFSFVGMETQEVAYLGQKELNVTMRSSVTEMDEVVVNGIFERKAESFTGSATVINREKLLSGGNRNLLQNLRNIDPSFKIVENLEFGSDPNRMPEIQMRGEQSIPDIEGTYSGNPNQPLFILDGFEADMETVFDLDMNRVQTVVLLKDAAAKAIYGSRAANGVVVIETVRPLPGTMRITYKGDLNITVPDLTGYNLCDINEKYEIESQHDIWKDYIGVTPEYLIHRENHLNEIKEAIEKGVDTYWLSKPLHVGVGHKHSLYLEGGDERIRYSMNLMYNNISGAMKGSDRNTFTGGFTLSYQYKDLLFRNQFSVTLNRADDSPYGSFSSYTKLNPYWTPYDENGELKKVLGTIGGGGIVEQQVGNPLYDATLNTKNFSKYTELTNNFYIEWNVLKNLKVTGRLGLTKRQAAREDFYPASHTRFLEYEDEDYFKRGSYYKNNEESHSISSDINLNYSFLKGAHQLFFNAGWSIREDESESVAFTAVGFPNDKMDFIGFANQFEDDSRPDGSESISREIGVLSAINYSYDDRYLADFSYRANGSSMFGADNKWGHFWSAGIGWNLHHERFLENAKWLNQFKLRASTGYTGSQNFNPYQALATFSYYEDQIYDDWLGSYLLGLPNDRLKWQKTQDWNAGFDMVLFNKLTLRFDYYVTNTKDQLLDITIPPSMGFTSYRENLGSTQNKGVELKLDARLFADADRDFYFNVFFSIAENKNKIKQISNVLQSFNDAQDESLSNEDLPEGESTWKPVTRYEEGQSLTAIWAVRSLGIDPASGQEMWLTKDGEITTTWSAEDQVVCGDETPKCTGTFGFNFDYKGIFMNTSFYYKMGGQVYNQTLIDRVENANIDYNVDRRIYDAVWTQPDDRVAFRFQPFNPVRPSSRFVQDLNELQMSSLSVGYDFKNCDFIYKWGLENLKASFYMDDVFRLSTVKIERGLEYPFARTFSISLQATF
jgi:TonB-linked SusC/RagA family outer membrane protein